MNVLQLALQAGLLLVTSALAGCGLVGCGAGRSPDEVVVEVNGQKITRGEHMEELRRGYGPLALKTLVDRAIVQRLAAEKGLTPEAARVEWKLELQQSQAGGAQALEDKLTARGQTIEDLRESLAQEALAEQIMAAQVDVADREIEGYYASHKDDFRHGEMIKGRLMLLESRKNAEEIHSVLGDPKADFGGLAKALSTDPGTKDESGDMGWVERGDYTSEITDAAFKVKAGQFTDVIECPDGWAIVLVEDTKPAGYKPFEEVRDTIESIIRREEEAALRSRWAAEQRRKARIKIPDKDLAERFALIRDS